MRVLALLVVIVTLSGCSGGADTPATALSPSPSAIETPPTPTPELERPQPPEPTPEETPEEVPPLPPVESLQPLERQPASDVQAPPEEEFEVEIDFEEPETPPRLDPPSSLEGIEGLDP